MRSMPKRQKKSQSSTKSSDTRIISLPGGNYKITNYSLPMKCAIGNLVLPKGLWDVREDTQNVLGFYKFPR